MPAPEKLSLIIQSGDRERVYYALVMAAAALAIGKPVTLFFTMDGTHALTRNWIGDSEEAERHGAGIADMEELMSSCIELKGRFMVCETGLRAAGLQFGDLREDIPVEQGSAVSFLSDASRHGVMLYI